MERLITIYELLFYIYAILFYIYPPETIVYTVCGVHTIDLIHKGVKKCTT
jgi:hypothetical protein